MKIQRWSIVVLAAMMAWACSDDDNSSPEVPDAKKLVFSLADKAMDGQTTSWILLSDQDGTVLDTEELHNQTDYTFEAPAEFTGVDLTLTLIVNLYSRRNEFKSTTILTYAHVPFGRYGWATSMPVVPPTKGEAVLHMQGDTSPSATALTGSGFSSWGGTWSADGQFGDFLATCYLKTDHSELLITKTDAPFRYIFTEIEVGKEYTFTTDDYALTDVKEIQAPDAEYASYAIAGVNATGSHLYYNDRALVDGANKSVPVIPNMFTSYEVTLSAETGDVYESYYVKGNKIPDAMKHIDGTLTYSATGNTFSWQTTGKDLDAVSLESAYREGHDATSWRVYGPAGDQKIAVPVIPDEIPLVAATTAARSFETFSADHGLTSELQEYPGLVSYTDVVIRSYFVPGVPVNYTELLTRSRREIKAE